MGAAQVQRGEPGFIGERCAITRHLPRQIVAHDVLVQQRIVLGFGLEREYPDLAGHRRPDRIHADIGADVEHDLPGLKAGYPF